jgi:ABC-type multidrug transport system fused ATPase/permease subunit
MRNYRKAFRLLTRRERRRGALVLGVVLIVALFEAAAVVSIVPFMSALGDPGMVQSNSIMKFAYDRLGFESTADFLMFLGLGSFTLLITAAVVRIWGKYVVTTYAQMLRSSIETRLLENYLRQPYEFHLNRHSGDLTKSILSEVDLLIFNVFQPIANMVAQAFTLTILLIILLVYNPWVALSALFVLGGAYAVIYRVVRRYIDRIGKARALANRGRFETAVEAIGGIKDIRLLGREEAYLHRFQGPSRNMSRYIALDQVLGQVPKFLIEAIAFGSILLLSLVLIAGEEAGGLGKVLPVLGLYAFAGYRILPAIQQIYRAVTQMRFGAPGLDTIHDDLRATRGLIDISGGPAPRLPLHRNIGLRSVSYGYPGADKAGVQQITLDIPAGTSVGIVGSTGAGKTTLVDLILGLLLPTSGHIEVDGASLTPDTLRRWQANIGYVPQDIFLVDASIAANIALGVPENEIDAERVRECARMAQVDRFIEEELPERYETRVGERGVRLSGGQKQRIGIARALYHDPEVIVFDEATSALDNLTERDVMAAVGALQGQKTIIMIAHRLSTVKICDRIVVLEKGRQIGEGAFHELAASNPVFRRMLDG